MQHVKDRKGSTHAPKQVEFVDSLAAHRVGKVVQESFARKYWQVDRGQVG